MDNSITTLRFGKYLSNNRLSINYQIYIEKETFKQNIEQSNHNRFFDNENFKKCSENKNFIWIIDQYKGVDTVIIRPFLWTGR